jgi:hypothetical protein
MNVRSRRAVFLSRPHLAFLFVLLVCLIACALPLRAQSRAFFDRDTVALDQTINLTIEVDSLAYQPPDFAQFLEDFKVVDVATRSEVDMSGGQMAVRIAFILRLQPMREGWIDVPPFRIGDDTVGPLRLFVTAPLNPSANAAPPPPPTQANQQAAPVILQTAIEPGPVYVQQSVGYVVRLYYESSRLIDGRLDQPQPVGASLLKVGDDIEADQMVDGRPFKVLERRFLLVPNRPGPVSVPGPKFEGRGMASMFDEMFGGTGDRGLIRLTGNARSFQALPIPANAPQPWLPVHNVRLRYLAAERSSRVGQATKVTVELMVEGANAVLLPELQLQADGDAQVFAEPAQTNEDFANDRPRALMVREFSVVPGKPGALRLVAPRIQWWDVKAGVARTASLPDLRLDVAPASGQAGPAVAVAPVLEDGPVAAARKGFAERFSADGLGRVSIAILAVLWLITLAWAWKLWSQRRRGQRTTAASVIVAPGYDAFAYKRLFDNGSLQEIADALCTMAQPAAKDLDRLRAMLDDPAQRAAIDALQRARWGDGGIIEVRAELRTAFAQGPRWRQARRAQTPSILPPLYPEV